MYPVAAKGVVPGTARPTIHHCRSAGSVERAGKAEDRGEGRERVFVEGVEGELRFELDLMSEIGRGDTAIDERVELGSWC